MPAGSSLAQHLTRERGMARKTILVSDLTGKEINEKNAAQVVITSPTQLPSLITGASRNCGSTAGPIPTATRANLRARRRALHTVWPRRLARASAFGCGDVTRCARRQNARAPVSAVTGT